MTWVGTALAIYGAYEGNRQRRAGQREMREQDEKNDQMIAEQRARQQQLDGIAAPWMSQGNQNMNMFQSHLRQIAGGDPAQTMQALAPNINGMIQQSQGAVAAQRNLMPRGGMGAAAGAQIPQQLQGGINNMMMGARQNAMGQLGQLGANQLSLGLGAMGQGAGLTNSMLQYGLDARNQQFQQGMQAGQGMVGYLDFINRTYQQGMNNWNNRDKGGSQPYGLPNQRQFNTPQNVMAPKPQASQSGQGSTYSLYNSNNVYGGST